MSVWSNLYEGRRGAGGSIDDGKRKKLGERELKDRRKKQWEKRANESPS